MLGRQFLEVEAMLRGSEGPPVTHPKKMVDQPAERLHKEIKRRIDVVGIFPIPAALLRLSGAVLVEFHDERRVFDRRHLSEGSMACSNEPTIRPRRWHSRH
jgi:putative transposase